MPDLHSDPFSRDMLCDDLLHLYSQATFATRTTSALILEAICLVIVYHPWHYNRFVLQPNRSTVIFEIENIQD